MHVIWSGVSKSILSIFWNKEGRGQELTFGEHLPGLGRARLCLMSFYVNPGSNLAVGNVGPSLYTQIQIPGKLSDFLRNSLGPGLETILQGG